MADLQAPLCLNDYSGIDIVEWRVDVVGVDRGSIMLDNSNLDFASWVIDTSGSSVATVVIILVSLVDVLVDLEVVLDILQLMDVFTLF